MSTRAYVGIRNTDGTVETVYTHFDGYPDHHGPILLENYAEERKLRDLLALGSLSMLEKTVGVQHPFSRTGSGQSWEEWEKAYGGMCLSYRRDRGDTENIDARRFQNEEQFWEACEKDAWIQYAYLFKDGSWHYRETRSERPVSPLKDWEQHAKEDAEKDEQEGNKQ